MESNNNNNNSKSKKQKQQQGNNGNYVNRPSGVYNKPKIRNWSNKPYMRKTNSGFRTFNKRFDNVIKIQNPKTINMNITRNDKNMIITGKDIILTQDKVLNSNGLYAVIPINPAYWDNTRIKNLAILNQYYIPINIKIEYVPLVSKFQKGNITIGTIANSTMDESNIQSTLISSTSGITYSCSTNFVRDIQLQSLIPQRKLLINSKLDKESVPFYICIYFNGIKEEGEDILPGQFYINYMFKFFNPVTSPNSFKSQQNIRLSEFDTNYFNISCILTQSNNNYKVGTILDVEYRDEAYHFLFNGSEANIDNQKLGTFLYSDKYEQAPKPDPPQPEPTKTDYDLSSYTDSGSGAIFDLNNGYDIYVNIPYTLEYIEVVKLRTGVTTLNVTLSNSYYQIFKSNESITGLPEPINDILTKVLSLQTQANFTKLVITTENVNFIGLNNTINH